MKCKHEGCDNDAYYNKKKKYQSSTCTICKNNLTRYNLTTPERDTLLVSQGGRCKCCDRKITFGLNGTSKHAAVVDHCHKYGHVRAIICGRCNNILGQVNDNPLRLYQMAHYLEDDNER